VHAILRAVVTDKMLLVLNKVTRAMYSFPPYFIIFIRKEALPSKNSFSAIHL
jgi:hypothetical protein